MQVRKLKVFPVEAIVRGYITGSAWKEYQTSGTVHGMKMPEGLKESQEFPDGPIYTPSTKAEQGEHDENIHPDQGNNTPLKVVFRIAKKITAVTLLGPKYAPIISSLALKLYETAHAYALARGLIIADTKFEFGLDTEKDEVVLVDEVLTPDSSRFWSAANYEVGKSQESFDKQFLRDWLVKGGLKGKDGVRMDEEVVKRTGEKYREAYEKITGDTYVG